MDESKLDAECVSRNKVYGAVDHLKHLLKIGWAEDSPVIKKFLKDNFMSQEDLKNAQENLAL